MDTLVLVLATGFGSGLLKPAPGTWGSLVGLIIYYLLPLSWINIVLLVLPGIYICHQGEVILQELDSPKIVLDEIIGLWFALWMLPTNYYPVAFLLFRFFDITKCCFIDRLQQIPGGLGIMLDDLAAGLITRIIMAIILFIL